MDYTIQNKHLKVVISSLGGTLQSVRGQDDTEYIWQGDLETWRDKDIQILPYVARLTQGKYLYRGEEYRMEPHGFLHKTRLRLKMQDNLQLVLETE